MEAKDFSWNGIQIVLQELSGIPESQDVLSNTEKEMLQTMKAPKRRKEWIASRQLLCRIRQGYSIHYTAHRKPYLSPSGIGFSISHSSVYAGIALSDTHGNIAIDIETVQERVANVAPKFMNEAEAASAAGSSYLKYCTVIWCAKEAIYKITENGSLDFSKHYQIDEFSLEHTAEITGRYCCGESPRVFNLKYWDLGGSILVAAYELT
jgi:4'-phosphopantetheinyl transferase